MADQVIPDRVLSLAQAARRVTVLTGAGMSAESGVPTFRDAQTGLWERYDPGDLATPEAWSIDPELVWTWYEWRRALVSRCEPNAGHHALARWAEIADVTVVTQNVDDLHERAGSDVLTHLHGSLFAHQCDTCGMPVDLPPPVDRAEDDPLESPPPCADCRGKIRPGVVWFNEALPPGAFDLASEAVVAADLVVVVGTSGLVYPAAALPGIALRAGVPVIEINPNPSDIPAAAHWQTTAAQGLPALVEALTSHAR